MANDPLSALDDFMQASPGKKGKKHKAAVSGLPDFDGSIFGSAPKPKSVAVKQPSIDWGLENELNFHRQRYGAGQTGTRAPMVQRFESQRNQAVMENVFGEAPAPRQSTRAPRASVAAVKPKIEYRDFESGKKVSARKLGGLGPRKIVYVDKQGRAVPEVQIAARNAQRLAKATAPVVGRAVHVAGNIAGRARQLAGEAYVKARAEYSKRRR